MEPGRRWRASASQLGDNIVRPWSGIRFAVFLSRRTTTITATTKRTTIRIGLAWVLCTFTTWPEKTSKNSGWHDSFFVEGEAIGDGGRPKSRAGAYLMGRFFVFFPVFFASRFFPLSVPCLPSPDRRLLLFCTSILLSSIDNAFLFFHSFPFLLVLCSLYYTPFNFLFFLVFCFFYMVCKRIHGGRDEKMRVEKTEAKDIQPVRVALCFFCRLLHAVLLLLHRRAAASVPNSKE